MNTKLTLSAILIGTFLMLLSALGFTARLYMETKADRDRLQQNQNTLLHNGRVEITSTTTGRSHASAPALTIHPTEFTHSGDTLAKVARQVGIKLRHINQAATAATQMTAEIIAPLNSVPALPCPTPLTTHHPSPPPFTTSQPSPITHHLPFTTSQPSPITSLGTTLGSHSPASSKTPSFKAPYHQPTRSTSSSTVSPSGSSSSVSAAVRYASTSSAAIRTPVSPTPDFISFRNNSCQYKIN